MLRWFMPPDLDSRPPLVRLEAMVADRAAAMRDDTLGVISEELEDIPEPAPWIAAARTLEARGAITPDTTIYLVGWFLECITTRASTNDPELRRLVGEMDGIQRAHGIDLDEAWPLDIAAPAFVALNEEWNRRNNAILVATLRTLGHGDLADQLERDPAGFARRSRSGYHDLWSNVNTRRRPGPLPPLH